MLPTDKKNLLINFIKVNGTILKTNDHVYTLSTNKIKYFLDYTDFNPNNPDASVKVNKVLLDEWLKKYNLSRNPPADSNILPYLPSTIVSYQSGKERLNYICQITNIIKTAGGDLIFTFDTSKVKFESSNNPSIEISNNPSKTKIDTVFLEGAFNDIRIDFDPLYDPKYKYNGDFSFFLQGDLEITKKKSKITKKKSKFIGSLSIESRLLAYRNWNPFDSDRNQTLEVYSDDLTHLVRMLRKYLINSQTQAEFKPTTTIEYLSKDKLTSTNIVQIKDMYVGRHHDNTHRVYFELNNKVVKFFNGKTGYKSVNKVLKKGIYYGVRMDIDSCDCGDTAGTTCGTSMGCYYSLSSACCYTKGNCPSTDCSNGSWILSNCSWNY